MIFRFTFRVDHPFELGKERIRCVEDPQIQMELLGKRLFDLFLLSTPKQAVVDEDTGQLVADGPMGEGRRHRRIHPAAQGANHSLLADLLANLLHRRIHIRLHRPGRFAAANVVDEIAE